MIYYVPHTSRGYLGDLLLEFLYNYPCLCNTCTSLAILKKKAITTFWHDKTLENRKMLKLRSERWQRMKVKAVITTISNYRYHIQVHIHEKVNDRFMQILHQRCCCSTTTKLQSYSHSTNTTQPFSSH